MDGYLKQSTAVTLKLGPFVDDTDGATPETGLTIAQADVRLSKNAGNMAQKGNATSCTHDEIGMYDCPLSTTDTGTLGALSVNVKVTGALSVKQTYMVVSSAVYDALFGTDNLKVNTTEWAGTVVNPLINNRVDVSVGAMADNVQTAASIAANAITNAKIAADAIGSSEFAQAAADKVWSTAARALTDKAGFTISGTKTTLDVLQDIPPGTEMGLTNAAVDKVWDEAQAGHTIAGTFGKYLDVEVSSVGGGGTSDWTAAEREQFRSALGIDGTKTAATGGQLQNKSELVAQDVADALKLAPTAGAPAADSVMDTLDAKITSRSSHTAADAATATLTTVMTESYAAQGAAPTLAQAMFLTMQQAGEFAISGTTITTKKLDGIATAATFTLDDATNPTSRTRAT